MSRKTVGATKDRPTYRCENIWKINFAISNEVVLAGSIGLHIKWQVYFTYLVIDDAYSSMNTKYCNFSQQWEGRTTIKIDEYVPQKQILEQLEDPYPPKPCFSPANKQ